ncbi:MAG: nucleotidyl transferase AbiEii/AbiGii toxin family protein [Actinobacteria bacterium]|nr:nucleotidyl transferase AbiEii/AbiGii toxin family protein [Actinomycetota bacterium]
MRVTEGHLGRHYQGRAGGRGPALLDIAQDHALAILQDQGLFELGVVFKGGTALRKYRAGNSGRFSTDLDLYAPDPDVAEMIFEALDNNSLDGFSFNVEVLVAGRRARLLIDTPFGVPDIDGRIDISLRPLILPAETLEPIPLPVHDRYDIELRPTPVVQMEELIAEKLARYRRASLARDLYDLSWASYQLFDEPLARRLWVLKCYLDIVDDGLGDRPIDPATLLRHRPANEFDEEAIGYLTTPIDIPAWETRVRTRYTFVANLTDDEQRWSEANRGDEWAVRQAADELRERSQ